MKLAGIPTLSVKATAAVGLGVQAMEVALVLDNTGSMAGSKLALNPAFPRKRETNIVSRVRAAFGDAA